MTDLTAILLPEQEHDANDVAHTVLERGYGDLWLRLRRLAGPGLLQVEVCDARGMPCVHPALIERLSSPDKRATFVHVNHQAGQALVHHFSGGKEVEGWMGAPGGGADG